VTYLSSDWERGFVAGWNAARDITEELIGDLSESTAFAEPMHAKAPAKRKSRKKSAWQKYMAKKANQIKFTRGPKKGRLDLKKMGRAYRRSRK
jgi:hypothetical protein